jgi:hypothetical protein
MAQGYQALREIQERLLDECRAITEEQSAEGLQRKPFDAAEHRLQIWRALRRRCGLPRMAATLRVHG